MKKMKIVSVLLLLVLASALLTACIPGDGSYSEERPANFLSGIWHGWIAPISLIVGLFKHGIRVYEQTNTGWWYDFGFYIAVISGFGGLALTRRSRRAPRNREE